MHGCCWPAIDCSCACTTGGARYPLRIDPFVRQAELTASDGLCCDELGYSVAADGRTIAVGAPFHEAVYVFSKPASGWANATQTAELTASDGGGALGSSVAMDGQTIVAGDPSYAVINYPLDDDQGAVYVFSDTTSGWANGGQIAVLTASDSGFPDGLGSSVALEGRTIVAGAPTHGAPDSIRGAVYVFSKPASGSANGTQTAELTASDGAASDQLGLSVAVAGPVIAAGSLSSNSVYVFCEPPSGWLHGNQAASLTASDVGPSDELGFSVAMSDRAIVAGAPQHEVGGTNGQGRHAGSGVRVRSAPDDL